LPHRASLIDRIQSIPGRELYFFSLYRVLIAFLISALVFGPLPALAGQFHNELLARWLAVGYLLISVALLVWGRSERSLQPVVFVSVLIDVTLATLFLHAVPGASAGIAASLLFNLAAGAMLLPLSRGLIVALLASIAAIAEFAWSTVEGSSTSRTLAELAMFATSYVALAFISHHIAQRARRNQQLAEKRSAEVANLYEINELIIRRMRTGVLVVDGTGHITLINEAAALLLGNPQADESAANGQAAPTTLSPELAKRLRRWRTEGKEDESPLRLLTDQTDVQPRFARLLANSDWTLIFLDDSSIVSRRAESLTLSTLGRFSASLAHEIRNPLAAITYATQLLEESTELNDTDRRLLQIIYQQCQRTNGIVESVLGMARRERANPENMDLVSFARRFVLEYRQTLPMENDSLETIISHPSVYAQVDPKHLHQILTTLVHNALKYGRTGQEPARIRIRVAPAGRHAIVDVMDRGPGIPDGVAAQLFRPFYTTSEHGTGLGLYIARELCRANQSQLDYIPVPGGGACFRITLPTPNIRQPG
jgi:two-component system sensor histidine kinase PilS (NtrC family)